MKKVIQFCLIVFSLSWITAGIFYVSGVDLKGLL